MESRMKPAAAASLAPLFAYTSELTADVVKTRPAARKPTIYGCISMVDSRQPKRLTYSDIVRLLSIRGDSDEDSKNAEESIDHGPPCEVWVVSSDICDDGRDEGYEPGEL
jgi:hypothetical protein